MRSFPLLTAILAGLDLAKAHPGMGQMLKGLKNNPRATSGPSSELIGDLITLADEDLSPTGGVIKRLLTSFQEFPENETDFYEPLPPPQLGSQACKADTCCIWKHIADELHDAYVQSDLQCNDLARAAVRLGFHDPGTWNRARGSNGGGADGSIILAGECEARADNLGLETICAQMRVWYDKYKAYGISMADLIQVSAYVAIVTCPMGPRIRLFVGRKDNSAPSPEGLMPFTHQTAEELISLFEDKTILGEDLVALLGAHTVAKQRFDDPSQAGAALDSTPGVWDVTFYNETLWTGFPKSIYRFKSDLAIGNQQSSAGNLFRQFANRGQGGADGWPPTFAKAYIRLSLLGVYNLNDLTECTSVLPRRVTFNEVFPTGRPDPF